MVSVAETPIFLEEEPAPIQKLEYPRGKEALPEKIDNIFWDVDGTITDRDEPDEKIIRGILKTATTGTRHNLVTGRDRFWMLSKLKPSFVEIARREGLDYNKAFSNIYFYPELGLISLDPLSGEPRPYPDIRDHPLVIGSLRDRIASFFLQSKDLIQAQEGQQPPPRHFIMKDANGVAYFCPIISHDLSPDIKLPDFIWSETKELIGTAEVVRDAENRIAPWRQSKILIAADLLNTFLLYWDYHKDIVLSPVSTAINITPVIRGIPLDKDWAAGMILMNMRETLQQKGKNVTIEELAARSIGIGDGYADFLFSRPRIEGEKYLNVAFAFVGPKDQMPKNSDQTQNLVVYSEGYFGTKATSNIWAEIQDRLIAALD